MAECRLLADLHSQQHVVVVCSSSSCSCCCSSCLSVYARSQNAHFWLVCVAYSMSVSIYGVWSSLFGVILKDVMDEVQL